MAGHPWVWAGVGAGKLDSNHAWTGGENSDVPTSLNLPRGCDIDGSPEREEWDPITDPIRTGQPGGRGGRADRHPAPSWPVGLSYPTATEHKHPRRKLCGNFSSGHR